MSQLQQPPRSVFWTIAQSQHVHRFSEIMQDFVEGEGGNDFVVSNKSRPCNRSISTLLPVPLRETDAGPRRDFFHEVAEVREARKLRTG